LDSITEDVFEWEVCFTIRGPDRRYNPGKINLSKHSVKRLKNYLEIASQELLTLQETLFAGTFSKVVSPALFVPKIEIVAENCKAWTSLWVSSQTFAFPVKLTIDDLSIITAKLERLEEKGKQMVATLKRLCKNDTSAAGCV
jgi:hypothetical protein